MNKKTIKKALLLTVCAILLVVASVMGTLAYLSDGDKVVNTFSVGQVGITLTETDTDGDSNLKANAYHLIPGTTYTKDPVVTVDANSESCFIFVQIDNQIAGIEDSTKTIASQIAANNWTQLVIDESPVPGVYFKTHTKQADAKTYPVFANVTVDKMMTNEQMKAVDGKTVTVTAYAIQQENLTNAATAWAALQSQLPTT